MINSTRGKLLKFKKETQYHQMVITWKLVEIQIKMFILNPGLE